jgi:hypothetical protein
MNLLTPHHHAVLSGVHQNTLNAVEYRSLFLFSAFKRKRSSLMNATNIYPFWLLSERWAWME